MLFSLTNSLSPSKETREHDMSALLHPTVSISVLHRRIEEDYMENLTEERVNGPQIEALNQKILHDVRPSAWQKLMMRYIGIIPQPVYVVLLGIVVGFVLLGKIPTEINM